MAEISSNKSNIIIVAGPTGVGKSALAVELALRYNGEVISADSMQVYRNMDIGSAKITPKEQKGVPHHLINVCDPAESFDVVRFKKMAKACIRDITERGKLPVIAGGTGFYIQALLYDVDFGEGAADEHSSSENLAAIRDELNELNRTHGSEYLHSMLKLCDPESAASIHPNNIKRIIRALEYHRLTGSKISAHNTEQRQRPAAYGYLYAAVTDERETIYQNIEKRVDKMLEEGLVDEVKTLMAMGLRGDMVSMQGLGYKEIYDYLSGETDFETAVYLIKRDTRHFAKRQLTWLRREKDVYWVNKRDFSGDTALMAEYIYREYINRIG